MTLILFFQKHECVIDSAGVTLRPQITKNVTSLLRSLSWAGAAAGYWLALYRPLGLWDFLVGRATLSIILS